MKNLFLLLITLSSLNAWGSNAEVVSCRRAISQTITKTANLNIADGTFTTFETNSVTGKKQNEKVHKTLLSVSEDEYANYQAYEYESKSEKVVVYHYGRRSSLRYSTSPVSGPERWSSGPTNHFEYCQVQSLETADEVIL